LSEQWLELGRRAVPSVGRAKAQCGGAVLGADVADFGAGGKYSRCAPAGEPIVVHLGGGDYGTASGGGLVDYIGEGRGITCCLRSTLGERIGGAA